MSKTVIIQTVRQIARPRPANPALFGGTPTPTPTDEVGWIRRKPNADGAPELPPQRASVAAVLPTHGYGGDMVSWARRSMPDAGPPIPDELQHHPAPWLTSAGYGGDQTGWRCRAPAAPEVPPVDPERPKPNPAIFVRVGYGGDLLPWSTRKRSDDAPAEDPTSRSRFAAWAAPVVIYSRRRLDDAPGDEAAPVKRANPATFQAPTPTPLDSLGWRRRPAAEQASPVTEDQPRRTDPWLTVSPSVPPAFVSFRRPRVEDAAVAEFVPIRYAGWLYSPMPAPPPGTVSYMILTLGAAAPYKYVALQVG